MMMMMTTVGSEVVGMTIGTMIAQGVATTGSPTAFGCTSVIFRIR